MKSRFALVVCLSVTLALSVSVGAQSGPDPNQPYIQSIAYGGTGCPQGSVGTMFANNRLSFTLMFDRFVASSGPGVQPTENRKNCQLNLNIRVPAGSGQFCAAVDYRGYMSLPAGVSAEQKAIYYFQGEDSLPAGRAILIGDEEELVPGREDGTSVFTGPASKDYRSRDYVPLSWNEPEPRVVPLNINSQVRLINPGSAQAQITTDSIDATVVLQECEPEAADVTPPTITITNPVQYGLYGLGAAVTPSFTCQDDSSGVASCTASPVLDTTSVGPKTFTVTAVDNAGNTSTASVSYAVGGKNECKGGGHGQFLAPTFKNQGQCVSSFVQ